MPYVKPTVHLSRIAGTALKSFTHGYAQTVVAASQSSYAAQTTQAGPLADTLIGRFRKSEKSRLQNVHHYTDGSRQASTSNAPAGRPDSSHNDSGLEKYFDAWQKHQHNGTKEWHQFQFAKRIEWQPPTTVPSQAKEASVVEDGREPEKNSMSTAPIKRSYTTSAVDNFGKAFIDDEVAEAAALEQVNIAIAEEIQRTKEVGDVATLHDAQTSISPEVVSSSESEHLAGSTPATLLTPAESTSSAAESEPYTNQLLQLLEQRQYEAIPTVFQGMLRAGVQQPTPAAYRALLGAAMALTHGKHQKVPKALEVYSDMLRRNVTPDTATFSTLISLLAARASEAIYLRESLEARLTRYGGLEGKAEFIFDSSQSEYAMLLEDSSLAIAMKMFDRAMRHDAGTLSENAYATLVTACAQNNRVEEMTRIYDQMETASIPPQSAVYPPMITAFGRRGDLRSAVEVYDEYKQLAIDNNAGKNNILRNDNEVYAALIKAYGTAARLKGGLKFLSSVQSKIANDAELCQLREVVVLQALLPLALNDDTYRDAFDLANTLTGRAYRSALAAITIHAADKNMLDVSLKAFDMLTATNADLASSATAILAMHVRNANIEAAEPYWRILESAPATLNLVEPVTMRAVALLTAGQAERGVRQSRRMFARIRDQQAESNMADAVEQIDEAIELMGRHMLKSSAIVQAEASIELLRTMTDNGGLIANLAEHIVTRFGPEHIARLCPADLEVLLRVQGSMILNESAADIASSARFACLLENVVSRAIMPSTESENLIERTLINLDRADLSTLWSNYRYPPATLPFTPAPLTPVVPFQAPSLTFDDSFDPYTARTDVKGSNTINELLERHRSVEALSKFRNMRRLGRVPRMFTYGKLIESVSKENNFSLVQDILEMAKQDVPFDARYRVVRFGWQQILDHMVAACLTVNRRGLAARYHQDMLDMGLAPSANTFGLYITTLKENTKTFDEASEAVKIFQRAKAEGVEPSSFLYNALIGKLGKARRIDDCLFYFAEMRNLGIRPTSVTYGTVVNALCRVSDEKFAEEVFEEMEACTNYKPRPAPYHSLMQFFLTTKRDRGKVLAYYERMRSKGIQPTVHTYKLLIDTHATLEPISMTAAEDVLADMQSTGIKPEAVHYASLIHAKGCVLHDMAGARKLFNDVASANQVQLLPCMYQALFESLNANHQTAESDALLADMLNRRVEFTPYIANALIHGWTQQKNVGKAKEAFDRVPLSKREPSTYEAMVRAHLAAEDRTAAKAVVGEALSRGYPSAVAGKIAELVR